MMSLQITLKKLINKTVLILIYVGVLFLPVNSQGVSIDKHINLIYHTDSEIISQFSSSENLKAYQYYRLALAYKNKKNYFNAKKYFVKSAFKNIPSKPIILEKFQTKYNRTEYYDISVYHLIDIFYHEYKYKQAINFYKLISKYDPAIFINASFVTANCHVSLAQYSNALGILKNIKNLTEKNNSQETLRQIRLAGVYSKKKDYSNAKKLYLDVLKSKVSIWQKKIAAENLYSLLNKKLISLSKKEKYILGKALVDSGKTKECMQLINSFQDKDFTMLKIKALVKQRKISTAEKLAYRQKSKNQYIKIFADSLWQKGYRSKPAAIYKKYNFFKNYEEALRRLIDYNLRRNLNECQKYLDIYLSKYKNPAIEYYVWSLAKENIEKNHNKTAIKILEKYNKRFPAGTYLGNSIYWLWKLKKSDTKEALKELILKKPSSAYTWILFEQNEKEFDAAKRKLQFNSSIKEENMDDALFNHFIISSLDKNNSDYFKRLEEINSKGMNSFEELNEHLTNNKFPLKFRKFHNILSNYFYAGDVSAIVNLYTYLEEDKKHTKELYKSIFLISKKYDYYYYQYIFTRKLLKLYNQEENLFLIHPEIAEALYPKAFISSVEKYCKIHNLDPSLILGIIRTESAFNPKARSSSNARGLMQLMRPTLKETAQRMKLKKYNITDIDDNIKIGTWYFKWLLDYFDNNKLHALGAYNGGIGNMRKWKSRYDTKDELFFIEKIPFPETRNYILMILKYEQVYNRLY